jgi:D-xylose transport system permease protein
MSQETKSGNEPFVTAASAPQADASDHAAMNVPARFTLGQLFKRDVGVLPVFVALVLEIIFFQFTTNGLFLNEGNIYNLVGQMITTSIVALAAVMVLLIGEIDLSLAAVSAMCGAVMGVLAGRHGWPAAQAIAAGLVVGIVIGLINGFFVAVLRMPSFIVTLAGLIFYQGLISKILEPQTTLPVYDKTIDAIALTNLPDVLAIGLPLAGLAVYIGSVALDYSVRQRRHLAVKSIPEIAIQVGIIAVVVIGAMILFGSGGGTQLTFVILVALVIIFWFVLTRTAFGRHVYAVGGNAEAARRAGIRVVGLKIAMFTLASALAAVAGMLEVSRLTSARAAVDTTLLLNAIAAAVIGGVSLFGGRGSAWATIPGSLVVLSLFNGLALLNQPAAVVEMVEGAVLLVAVLVDALLRRRSQTGFR